MTENKKISQIIIDFHEKAAKMLKGKLLVDGYTVTIRDAIETATFINLFKGSMGTGIAIVLGIGRQYISKLKNEDKDEFIAVLKNLKIENELDNGEPVDIDKILYLGGKHSQLNLTEILGSDEAEQLGNLFRILTRQAPKLIEMEIEALQQMMLSNDKNVLTAAIKSLSFLPDKVNKTIIEFGLNIFGDEPEIFLQLITLAGNIKDDEWKKQIVDNEILPRLWEDIDNETLNARIKTVEILSAEIADDNWKQGIVEDVLLERLTNNNLNICVAAAGSIGAISIGTGDKEWKKVIIEEHLFPLSLDIVADIASMSVAAIGMLSVGLLDNDWKRSTVKNHLAPKLYDNKEKVRIAALEAIGDFSVGINSFSFVNEIVHDYLLEKLFDELDVQLAVMIALEKIFSTVENESWKQGLIEDELLTRLAAKREFQTVVISRLGHLFYYISDEKWKMEIIEKHLIAKLNSQDWYIHSETLKMLGGLGSCINSDEWKQKIVEEHFIPRLSFRDIDIQSSAALATGCLAGKTGTTAWRKNLLENHLLPKSRTEEDYSVSSSIFDSIGNVAMEIDDDLWRNNIMKDFMIKSSTNARNIQPVAAQAISNMIRVPLINGSKDAVDTFLKNLDGFLYDDSSASLPEGSFDKMITETEDEITIGRFTLKKNKTSSPFIPGRDESALINTKTTVEDLEFLAASIQMNKPVLEIGPTATRKSALIQYMAFLTNTPYIRFNLNGQTDKYEFIGGYKPQTITLSVSEAETVINRTIDDSEHETLVSVATKLTGTKHDKHEALDFVRNALNRKNNNVILNVATLILDSASCLEWQDGILIDALRNGCYLNLDELNLSETEVLERINPLLDDEGSLVVYEHENEKYINEEAYNEIVEKQMRTNNFQSREESIEFMTKNSIYKTGKNFKLFATMNPKEYKGRNKLSDPFLNRWRILRIEELPDAELAEIMKSRYQTPGELIMSMILFHQSICEQAEKGVLGKRQREEYHFTIRDLIRVFERIKERSAAYTDEHTESPDKEKIRLFMAEAVNEVYGMVFRDSDDRNKYGDFYKKAFGEIELPVEDFETSRRQEYVNCDSNGMLVIGNINQVKLQTFQSNLSPNIPARNAILTPVKSTLQYIKTISRSLKLNEPVHLVGPTASAKTSIVRYLAFLTNSGFQRVSLAGQTDTADIIGQYQSSEIRGHYAWKDGTLLQAMKEGDYLLLDELNLAEPQILERINSLLDIGRIVISEHNNEVYMHNDIHDKMVANGNLKNDDTSFIKIHPNFRIIAASNPVDTRHQGRTKLSLAFRNRFREMWMEEISNTEELVEIVGDALCD